MRDVRIDEEGRLACWRCGSREFQAKRTFRSKVTTGPFALLTHKKLKCLMCAAYNQTGSATPDPVTRLDIRSADKANRAAFISFVKELFRK